MYLEQETGGWNAERGGEAAALLDAFHGGLSSEEVLSIALRDIFVGRVALVSSFGAEAAVLLHLVAGIDRSTPVLFIDTGKHFPETLAYRNTLISRLRLTDVRSIGPEAGEVGRADPGGDLWRTDPDRCCALRKVRPLEKALGQFDAWITGRKRYQAATRAELPLIEAEGRHVKINPLARWSGSDVEDYLGRHDLPRHPLVVQGFPSIGCEPCTARAGQGEDARAGRWRGREKTECGIHVLEGRVRRPAAARAGDPA